MDQGFFTYYLTEIGRYQKWLSWDNHERQKSTEVAKINPKLLGPK